MKRSGGWTLIEMIAVLSIIGILTQGAASGLRPLLAGIQARTSVQNILEAIRLARYSSVSLYRPVTICPSIDARNCAGDWHGGILTFVDENGNGVREATERALHHFRPSTPGSRIEWKAFRRKPWLQFLPQGHTAQQNGSFVYCPGDLQTEFARVVIVNKLGHSRLGRDTDGDRVVEMANGRPVQC